jgi:hypothetical protein
MALSAKDFEWTLDEADPKASRTSVGSKMRWDPFYLTRDAVAIVPSAAEAMRVARHYPQEIPFAKIRGSLATAGPLRDLFRGGL